MQHHPGVKKYDGYNYKNIGVNDIFKSAKKTDWITSINKDYKNNIWVTSENGLFAIKDTLSEFKELAFPKEKSAYKVSTDHKNTFISSKEGVIYKYNYEKKQLDSITSIVNIVPNISKINQIKANSKNEIFISTDNGFIYKYSQTKKELTSISGSFSNFSNSLHIVFDLNDNLWIGTETLGLHIYNTTTEKFIENSIYKGNKYNINNEMIISLFRDSIGHIWAGTDGGGLYHINPESGQIKLYTHNDTNKFSLTTNTIIDINEDSHKNIWITTNYGGVNILPQNNNSISYHEGSINNTPTRILTMYRSAANELWIGTDGSGITRIQTNKDKTTTENQYFNNTDIKKGFYVQSITEDNLGNIWFGTYKNGLWHYNTKQNKFSPIIISNSENVRASDVRTIYKDSKHRIWVSSNISTAVYNNQKKQIAYFENNTHGAKGLIAESIIEDKNGELWFGFYKGGLFKFIENTNYIQNSHFKKHDYTKSISKTTGIISMASSNSSDLLWLISYNGTLSNFNINTKTYTNFDTYKSLVNTSLRAVLTENKQNLWLSSTNGLIHLNLKDSILRNYYETDGLQDNLFLSRSAFKDQEGKLYFGGIKGINTITPNKITKEEAKTSLYINNIEILNQSAKELIPEQIKSGINNVSKLHLNYNQSSFLFRFSAIGNVLAPNYYYAYRLKGFNDKWIHTPKELLATYTNIPPGNYTFEVKASSKKDLWNIPSKTIDIHIAKPFWNNAIAYCIYFLLIALIFYGLKKWYTLKNKLIFEKIDHKREKELHTLKMDFFTKMSHEIQTPLTLIIAPIDDMLTRAEINGNLLLKQRLQIISNNVKRLSRIAFELTTIRNKELKKIKLLVTKNNLFKELHQIALSFNEQARFKQIDFSINCPKNLSEVWYDKNKFEHIIYNLLSNAFKFTPKEGNIQITVVPINNKNSIKINIFDSGPGIPSKELKKIFTLFYQSKIGKQTEGTGIGLALAKELINLHRGKIKVKSSPTEGTTFTITLPVTKDAYLEDELINNNSQDTKPLSLDRLDSVEKPISNVIQDKTILIVEDNIELQQFLKDLFIPFYNVILAENGEEGFLIAKRKFPDLILSDVMMPKLDGIEMCKSLQKNPQTQHIPIVLLTAKNSTNSKITGLKSGAIEFINKPFNTNELLLKVKNIITSTEHIISKFKKEIISNPVININKTQDEEFLENLISIINSKIENPNFKMEELADALNISYSVLYRKCLALTGNGLVDLVRFLRLKKAAVVIAKYGYTISEAAYLSGFNDPKYFSKCFKKQFEKTPNTFKKEAQEMGPEIYLKKYNLHN
jgi:signal transduction histidine kinase/ligand-binding sensor domain-containing protein/AraC-like DNA-binding protein